MALSLHTTSYIRPRVATRLLNQWNGALHSIYHSLITQS